MEIKILEVHEDTHSVLVQFNHEVFDEPKITLIQIPPLNTDITDEKSLVNYLARHAPFYDVDILLARKKGVKRDFIKDMVGKSFPIKRPGINPGPSKSKQKSK